MKSFEGGRNAGTIQKLLDDLDLRRTTEAFLNALPIASISGADTIRGAMVAGNTGEPTGEGEPEEPGWFASFGNGNSRSRFPGRSAGGVPNFMGLFDFIFIAAFFFVVGSLVWTAVLCLRRQGDAACRCLRRLAIFTGTYMAVLIAVSIFSPQHVSAIGETRRFDDWCLAVTDVSVVDTLDATTRAAPEKSVLLTLRVFSEARRIRQAAPHASVHLLDRQGHRYDVFAQGQQAFERVHGPQTSLGTMLEPLGSFTTVRVFRVPAGLDQVDVVTPHGGGGPALFIIGDAESLLHRPTVVRVALAG